MTERVFTEKDVLEFTRQAYGKNPDFDIVADKCALLRAFPKNITPLTI
jgi:hypothetical protein